jgi:hypothetical protein
MLLAEYLDKETISLTKIDKKACCGEQKIEASKYLFTYCEMAVILIFVPLNLIFIELHPRSLSELASHGCRSSTFTKTERGVWVHESSMHVVCN